MVEFDAAIKREWHFKQLKWALQALAIPASDQRQLFPEGVAVADELALDFEHSAAVVRGSYVEELSNPQVTRLADIDEILNRISRTGADFKPELWAELALGSSQHWAEIRHRAAVALDAFGWSVELPPRNPQERGTTFVR